MSGHSKWATIKHKKGAADAKRGKIFTRIIKELTVAARAGGGDPDMNPRLRTIIADAKAQNMPADNIKRAIRRGTGEEPGVSYEEVRTRPTARAARPLIIDMLTDNKNRTVGRDPPPADKHDGNLAGTNAVAWMFTKSGYIVVEKSKARGRALMAAVLDAGADDLQRRRGQLGSAIAARRVPGGARGRQGARASSPTRPRSRWFRRTT